MPHESDATHRAQRRWLKHILLRNPRMRTSSSFYVNSSRGMVVTTADARLPYDESVWSHRGRAYVICSTKKHCQQLLDAISAALGRSRKLDASFGGPDRHRVKFPFFVEAMPACLPCVQRCSARHYIGLPSLFFFFFSVSSFERAYHWEHARYGCPRRLNLLLFFFFFFSKSRQQNRIAFRWKPLKVAFTNEKEIIIGGRTTAVVSVNT